MTPAALPVLPTDPIEFIQARRRRRYGTGYRRKDVRPETVQAARAAARKLGVEDWLFGPDPTRTFVIHC